MEDLIYFRKKRSSRGQFLSHEKACIKIEIPRGTFVIFLKVAKLLNATKGDAVMFAFSRKNNCAYIYKEAPEDDSYFLGSSGRAYHRFTSKDLMDFFVEFFNIEETKAVYFDVATEPNEKGMFKVTPQA